MSYSLVDQVVLFLRNPFHLVTTVIMHTSVLATNPVCLPLFASDLLLHLRPRSERIPAVEKYLWFQLQLVSPRLGLP